MNKETMNRRNFLRKTLGTTAAAASLPMIVPASALGRDGKAAPSERINLACIGVGLMGVIDLNNFIHEPDVEIATICDVDETHLENVVRHVRNTYNGQYGRENYDGPKRTIDFREVVADPGIDAVIIATPDHWHAIIAIEAMKAGKDVYGEKPLARTIGEGQAMVDAVRRYGRVFQTGTQTRSSAQVRHVVELVRNGRIGKLERVEVRNPAAGGYEPLKVEPIPEGFHYDMWLGPAPWAPYQRMRTHGFFRLVWDYSGGTMTDHGTHRYDIAQWGSGNERTGPVEIEGTGEFPDDGLFSTAYRFNIRSVFADGVVYDMRSENDMSRWGLTFHGSDGWINVPMEAPLPHLPITASDPAILNETLGAGEERVYKSDHHQRNFLDCIKSRRDPVAPVEVGHRSTSLCHLSNIAIKVGGKLKWDPEAERFTNSELANSMLDTAKRHPWKVG